MRRVHTTLTGISQNTGVNNWRDARVGYTTLHTSALLPGTDTMQDPPWVRMRLHSNIAE